MPSTTITPRWASVAATATYAVLSEKTVYRLIWSGQLPARRAGRRLLRVDLNDVDSFLRPVGDGAA